MKPLSHATTPSARSQKPSKSKGESHAVGRTAQERSLARVLPQERRSASAASTHWSQGRRLAESQPHCRKSNIGRDMGCVALWANVRCSRCCWNPTEASNLERLPQVAAICHPMSACIRYDTHLSACARYWYLSDSPPPPPQRYSTFLDPTVGIPPCTMPFPISLSHENRLTGTWSKSRAVVAA